MYPTIRLKKHQFRPEYRIVGATLGRFDNRQPVAAIDRTMTMAGTYAHKYEGDKSALLSGLEKAVANGTLREFLGWEAEAPVCEHCGGTGDAPPTAEDPGFDE